MATATATKSAAPALAANQVNIGTASAPNVRTAGAAPAPAAAGIPNASGGTTANVTGQNPQVLGGNGQPIPGAPKLDVQGNIIPGTGSTNIATSATPGAITNPPTTTPPVAPLNAPAATTSPATGTTAPQGGSAGATSAADNAVTGAKYKAAHAGLTAGGSTAPVNAGQGSAAASNAARNTGITQPSANPLDALFQAPNGPALQKALDQQNADRAAFLNSQKQGETLVQQYAALSNSLGLGAINTQMMNIKAVMDGSEADIRNEITKAGGFATNSQVLALTNARNQTNQLNYANLMAQKQNAADQINMTMGFSKEDKANAIAAYNEQMNFDGQQVTMAQQAQANTQTSLQNYLNQYGAAALMAATKGDPHYVSMVEQGLKMPAGGLASAVAHPSLDTQVKLATLAHTKASTAKLYSDMGTASASAIPSPTPSYTLQKGDDPYTIAQNSGTDIPTMKQLNPGVKDWSNIQPGVKLNLPAPKGQLSSNPQVDAYASGILNGSITSFASVPKQYKDQVAQALNAPGQNGYSPLAGSRYTMESNRIVNNFVNTPAYQLTAGGQLYLGRIAAAMKTPGSVSDQDLLDSLTKLNTGGNAISDAQVKLVTDGKSFTDWTSVLGHKLGNGGVLSNNQRNQIQSMANNIFSSYQSAYQPVYDQATSQLKAAGIPTAFWTIPDLNKLSAQAGQGQSQSVPTGQTTTINGVNYVSDGKQWVKQ